MSRTDLIRSVIRGNVLDIGYAVGSLHKEISKHNFTVGIDTVIRKPEKLVVKGDAENIPVKRAIFDTLLAGELIEHLEKPEKFIEESRYALKSNGLLIITTPNKDSLINRVFGSYEAPLHFSLMNKERLFGILEKNGFVIERFALFPYTEESSEGSKRKWSFFIRKLIHYILPRSLQEEMLVVAKKV